MIQLRKIHLIRYLPWLLCILLLVAVPITAAADYIQIRGSVVNVRQGPGTSHPVLFQAEQGEEFELLGTHGLWCRIRLQRDQEAWVFRNLVDIREGNLPGTASEDQAPEGSAADIQGWSRTARIIFLITFILLALVGILKRRAILRFTGIRLKEISGYKRDQAFRYDNRKPSDDSWEL